VVEVEVEQMPPKPLPLPKPVVFGLRGDAINVVVKNTFWGFLRRDVIIWWIS
jgi:hypothetical protein